MGKKKIRIIITVLHFIASFFYERNIIIFNDVSNTLMAIPRNQIISDRGEKILFYIIAKVLSAVIIYFLWKVIFYFADNIKNKKYLWIFAGLFVFLCVLFGVILYRSVLLRSADNYITYAYAKRLLPEYWHSAYTSYLYTACMMVFPHPISINVFQWFFITFDLAYIYTRLETCEKLKGKFKWLFFLIFTLPNTFILVTDPYRTEVYAIICMFFISVLALDAVEEKQRAWYEYVALLILAALLGVWRSEGIILGVCGFIAALIFVYRLPIKRIALYSICVLLAFVIISIPQKLGDKKYYGKDYTIINSFPTLQNILNHSYSHLDYEGAEEDLEAINRVVPLEVVQLYGMDGYRRYNIKNGRTDINQSYASDEDGEAYVKAFYNMVLHNLKIYAKTQLTMWGTSVFALDNSFYVGPVNVVYDEELPPMVIELWDTGQREFVEDCHFGNWAKSETRAVFANKCLYLRSAAEEFIRNRLHLSTIQLLLILAGIIYIVLKEFVSFCLKKRDMMGLGALALILLGQYAVIILVMPMGAQVYFHATYYCMLLVELIYFRNVLIRKREKK